MRAQVINDAEEWNMDLIYHSTDVVPGIYKVRGRATLSCACALRPA